MVPRADAVVVPDVAGGDQRCPPELALEWQRSRKYTTSEERAIKQIIRSSPEARCSVRRLVFAGFAYRDDAAAITLTASDRFTALSGYRELLSCQGNRALAATARDRDTGQPHTPPVSIWVMPNTGACSAANARAQNRHESGSALDRWCLQQTRQKSKPALYTDDSRNVGEAHSRHRRWREPLLRGTLSGTWRPSMDNRTQIRSAYGSSVPITTPQSSISAGVVHL
jgi:hypothetical protein